MKHSIPLVVFLSFLLQGCLGTQNPIKEDAVFLHSAPVCTTDDMCKQMWQAAAEWVDQYSPQGIEVHDENLISSEDKELGSDELDIEIKKLPQKDGSHKIVIDIYCRRALSSCSIERKNMIAFNKKLSSFMAVDEKAKKDKVFSDSHGINQWVKDYVNALNKFDVEEFSALIHFPVTYVEKNETKVLRSKEDVKTYLKQLASKLNALSGKYIKSDNLDVFSRAGRSLYVNVVLYLYDSENTVVGGQQTGFHLVKQGKQLKMISAGAHGE